MLRFAVSVGLCVVGWASCVLGAPPGFPSGEDKWTAPLVAPLEHDLLLVPVRIKDTGPYLFMVDPDSRTSALDSAIVAELELYTAQVADELSEADHRVTLFEAEVPKVSVGTLSVSNQNLRVFKVGTFVIGGRNVRGILGRDIIADSLIVAADRDVGQLSLATRGHLPAPAGAHAIAFSRFANRKLAKVHVAGRELSLHVDLGARKTMVWPELMDALKLPAVAFAAVLKDEYGVARQVTRGGIAPTVQVAGAAQDKLLVLPYGDRRVKQIDYDGALGQNFLARYNVTADWHGKRIYLAERASDPLADVKQRIGRWGGAFASCAQPGCAAAAVQTPQGGGHALVIERDPSTLSFAFEAMFVPVAKDGRPTALPPLLVTLAANVPQLMHPIDAAYAHVVLRIADVGPFPRPCERDETGAQKCVWRMLPTL